MPNDALREPVTHELKCWPESFEAIKNRAKTAEIRLDDRGFKTGDYLFLRAFDPEHRAYLGGEIKVRIRHIYRGVPIPNHFVLMSIEHLDSPPSPGLVEAAKNLVDVMDQIQCHPDYQAMISLAHTHGLYYKGPAWGIPLNALRSALAGEEWEGVTEDTPEEPCECGKDDHREDLQTMCWCPPPEEVLESVEHLWPGAIVMRRKGKGKKC